VADTSTVLLASIVTIACLMLATWSVSLLRRDASIVDIVWGLGFVLVVAHRVRAIGCCSSW